MSVPEFKGNETLYLIDIPQAGGTVKTVRLFNQTSGSRSIEAAEIELDTKDKSGSAPGKSKQAVSIGGVITEGDEGLEYIEQAIEDEKLVKIHEVNLRTKTPNSYKVKSGTYMLTKIDLAYENKEFSNYTIETKLNGKLTRGTLTTIPDGAPSGDIATP